MSERVDGGPAFPASTYDAGSHVPAPGMTLRDWFAGLAMQGWFAARDPGDLHEVLGRDAGADLAGLSYKMADAMLAARSEKP